MITFPMNQKLLFVHLLRLGDTLMLLPAIMSYRKAYPKSEIHLMLNDNCSVLSPLIERYVDKIIYFQRAQLQEELTDADANLFSPFYAVEDLIQSLNEVGYDYLINFTQNHLSALLSSEINAKHKYGMIYEEGEYKLSGDAFIKINDEENNMNLQRSHFIDIFFKALKIKVNNTDNWKFLGIARENIKPYILFQIHTNEAIKSLSTVQWIRLFEAMKPYVHNFDIKIICAPSEAENVEQILTMIDNDLLSNITFEACSFIRALELIESAELLVSVDTSIKHLSNFTNTRVLELSLGSSDIYRTGVYKPNSYIFQPNVACLPCSHSAGCTMSEHLCANSINLKSFASLIFTLARDPLSINEVYPELGLNGKLFITSNTENLFTLSEINPNIINDKENYLLGDKYESNT